MTPEQFNECVDLYADKLYRFVLKAVADEEPAKDIVQETFIKAWEKCSEIRQETARSYLFRIAFNNTMDHFRREKKSVGMQKVQEAAFYTEQPNMQLQEILDAAVDKLPPQQKTILLLRDYEGYSYDEIARIADVSLEQVKINLFRARKYLKNYLVSVEAVI